MAMLSWYLCPVLAAYKELRPAVRDKEQAAVRSLDVCAGHSLLVADGLVTVDGKAALDFFERAEEVEECNVSSLACLSLRVPVMLYLKSCTPVLIARKHPGVACI